MDDNRWYTYTALAIAAALGTGLLLGIGSQSLLGNHATTPSPAAGGNAAPEYLSITVAWNPANGLDQVFPGNFSVPSHTLLHVTVTSYDNGSNPVSSAYQGVAGTVGGTESIASAGSSRSVTSLPGDGIAHTITVMSMGSAGAMGGGPSFNVLIPPASAVATPIVVSFDAYFNVTGTYTWMCMAPCDSDAMITPGFMTGTLTVV